MSHSSDNATPPVQFSTTNWETLSELLDQPGRFFAEYLREASELTGASAAAILAKVAPAGSKSSWKAVAAEPSHSVVLTRLDADVLEKIAESASFRASDEALPSPLLFPTLSLSVLALPLPGKSSSAGAVLALLFAGDERSATLEQARHLLPLLASVPDWMEQLRQLKRAEADLGQFAAVLDLTVLLYSEDRFHAAAMLFCNEAASRYGCHRVSLGWLEGNDIRVRAISHTDKIEKRMEAVQQLAAAMEEATDQGSEILYPAERDRYAVDRDHKGYADEQKLTQVLTLPLLRTVSSSKASADPDEAETEPIAGALTLEKDQGTFSDQEIRSLRLLCDQATPRLWQLRQSDGWFGARVLRSTRKTVARLVGVDHTWGKLLAITLAIGLAVLVFGRKEFRVKAPFSVETHFLVYLSAPYAGYLGDTPYQEGDAVPADETVFALDTSELLLEKQQALAETTRYRAEAIRAEASGEVSEMRIAKAMREQAEARLSLVQHQLDHAQVAAPFDGVIVEGELTERVNSPVEQGEVLVKLAQLSGLFPELKIDESDVRFIESGATGELSFAARPDLSFPLVVDRIEPAARSDESGNRFTVRCRFEGEAPSWWRPGMSGVAKIDCGTRSLLWIFTRKTIDRIRLFLW